jgi:hypothetical protein
VRLRRLGAERDARFVMNHGAGALYRLGGDADALAQLAGEIATLEGVSGHWPAAEYAGLGLPVPAEHPLVADWMFEAAPGFCYGDAADGDDEHGPPKYLGTHGQRGLYADNAAFFLAAGAGVRRGVALGPIKSRDVGPTVAAALGLRMDGVEGAVLERALG